MTDVGPLVNEPPWLAFLRERYGLAEVPGPVDNPTIVQWHRDAGTPVDTLHDELAWCGVAAGAAFRAAGIQPPPKCYRAGSWADWGEECEPERLGALLLIHNPKAAANLSLSGNHVTFSLAVSPARIYGLGGNQSNMLKASSFPRPHWTIRTARWPSGYPG